MKLSEKPLIRNTRTVVRGYKLWRKVRRKYGNETHIILCRGVYDNLFLFISLLPAYLSQYGIKRFVVLSDCSEFHTIKQQFQYLSDSNTVSIKIDEGNDLQALFCFLGGDVTNMALSLLWEASLPLNRCAVRLTGGLNLYDSYFSLSFGLTGEVKTECAEKKVLSIRERKVLNENGVKKGKTVVLVPHSFYVRHLPPLFWRLLGRDLKSKGYTVFVLGDDKYTKNEFGLPGLKIELSQINGVIEYAGHCVSLYNECCCLYSLSKCNQVFLYPPLHIETEMPASRADQEFCSMKSLGLSGNATEITVPYARETSDWKPENEDLKSRIREERAMYQSILSHFPQIK